MAESIHDPDGKVVGTNSVYLPEQALNFSSQPAPVTPLELGWLPQDTTYGRRIYKASDDFQIWCNVVLMGSDRTSIHKPQYCLTGQGWWIDRSELTTIPMDRPSRYDLPVMKLTATSVGETASGEKVKARGVYVYWFVADNELTADHLQRMWWMAKDMLSTGILQRWAYITYFAVCAPGQEEGLVHFALARRDQPTCHREAHFGPVGRGVIRVKSLETMMDMLERCLDQE